MNKVALERYYQTRAHVLRETSRLIARALTRNFNVTGYTSVVIHAMGPWEMSHAGDLLFPNASRVATPFIHPGHWGEDEFSRRWFRSRDYLVALGEEDEKACRASGIVPSRIEQIPVIGPEVSASPRGVHERQAIVFLGIARRYKGIEIFVEMARILLENRQFFRFVWAGSIPPESAEFATVAESYGIEVLGAVSETEKEDLLQQTLCLCLPSQTEITPYSILEAWASGATIVTSDNAHMREFVCEGGMLVPRNPLAFAEAVQRLAADPDLVQRQVLAGQRFLRERHDRATITSRLSHLYARALRSRGQ